jgi:hypothetical protein
MGGDVSPNSRLEHFYPIIPAARSIAHQLREGLAEKLTHRNFRLSTAVSPWEHINATSQRQRALFLGSDIGDIGPPLLHRWVDDGNQPAMAGFYSAHAHCHGHVLRAHTQGRQGLFSNFGVTPNPYLDGTALQSCCTHVNPTPTGDNAARIGSGGA